MSDMNHRRKNRAAVNQRYAKNTYHNGYAHPESKDTMEERLKQREEDIALYKNMAYEANFPPIQLGSQRIGRTDYLDKSLHGWGRLSKLADKEIGASIGNDFSNGHRGMAKAVRGAKKFVRSRVRFQENAKTQKLFKGNEE